jgi:hypothetical protein
MGVKMMPKTVLAGYPSSLMAILRSELHRRVRLGHSCDRSVTNGSCKDMILWTLMTGSRRQTLVTSGAQIAVKKSYAML